MLVNCLFAQLRRASHTPTADNAPKCTDEGSKKTTHSSALSQPSYRATRVSEIGQARRDKKKESDEEDEEAFQGECTRRCKTFLKCQVVIKTAEKRGFDGKCEISIELASLKSVSRAFSARLRQPSSSTPIGRAERGEKYNPGRGIHLNHSCSKLCAAPLID